MARPAKFSRDDLLDGALAVVARHGREATVAQVSEHSGAPIGSLYHRFGSRDQLMVALWLRSVQRFHVGLLEAAALEDPARALAGSAVHIPRYCRRHPDEARALTLYRQADAVAQSEGTLRDDVEHLNDAVNEAMARLTVRRYGRATERRRTLVQTAVRQLPYGLVRPYLGVAPVPEWLDEVVLQASAATLALGDSPSRRT